MERVTDANCVGPLLENECAVKKTEKELYIEKSLRDAKKAGLLKGKI
jgi:hypothetical protein